MTSAQSAIHKLICSADNCHWIHQWDYVHCPFCVRNGTQKAVKMRTGIILISLALALSSCATFRSGMGGKYSGENEKNYNSEKVSILFIFKHTTQTKGLDAIPKLSSRHKIISGFDDIFMDAMNEITNVRDYTSFTDYSSDISDPKRKAMRDSLIKKYDYTIEVRISKMKSFSKFFFGTVVSVATLTVFPINYRYNYALDVKVFDPEEKLVQTYHREAHLNKWIQTLLVFFYPFHPEKRKEEELYVDFLHDVLRQIESEKILKAG